MTEQPVWEIYGEDIVRIKVDGGWLYGKIGFASLCFVPDIDLARYQAHLRDAYKQGYQDGREDVMIKHGITAEEIVREI